jgi:hypothetical protein
MYQSLWGAAKAIPRGPLIAIDDLKIERLQISNLTFHLQELK